MHKARRRRDDIILRTLTYIFMTIAVVVLAVVCLFVVLGYSIDKKTGSPQQGGLIQFRSFPEGAEVSVDGQMQAFKTPGKTTADAAQHSVVVSKKDYRNWSKNFNLGRGELLWLNVRLVPSSVTTTAVERFESLAQIMVSPDKKWIAALEKADDPTLKIIDIRDEKNPKTSSLKIPASAMKPPVAGDSFVMSEWDFDSRYLLVKHTSGAASEWLRIDRSDEANTKNITALLKDNFSQLHFKGSSGESFYGLAGGNLKKLQLDQSSPAEPLAQDVVSFNLYGDNKIALVLQKNARQLVQVYKDGAEPPRTIATFALTQPLARATITSLFGDDYAAVSHAGEVKIIKMPFDSKSSVAAKFQFPPDNEWLYFSPNGQFLVAQAGLAVKTYNLEREQLTQFTVPGDGAYVRPDHLEWLDDFHFWSDMGGSLRSFAFDGTNAEIINNVAAGHDVSLSNNGKRLFSIGIDSTTKKPVLQSSVMVVE